MNFITIDLGTTNTKVSAYDRNLRLIKLLSHEVVYRKDGDFVEFDCLQYFSAIETMIYQAAKAGKDTNGHDVAQIVLTGQAETLVMLDSQGEPAAPAISWLDMRSRTECAELSSRFPAQLCYETTGQPDLISTWPITKMLWLDHHEPLLKKRVRWYLLLKDYVVFRLCNKMAGDYSIYSFSHYFDIRKKCFWREILDFCHVPLEKLPKVLPPMSIAGALDSSFLPAAGLTASTKVNIGTLDHFAGMIGTGNIVPGMISESAGTVLSIATLIEKPDFTIGRLPVNCGPFPNTYCLLPVCESGGFSLEWYKNNFLSDINFEELNQALLNRLSSRLTEDLPVFLPYLTGVNSPDYNADASGVFFGLRAKHNRYDLALSVMEGVACLLKSNLDYMEQSGIQIQKIISTGGGAKSALWTQIKADITGQIIEVPENEEAPSMGAAIIGAVSQGCYDSFEEAVKEGVSVKARYTPNPASSLKTYEVFQTLYHALGEVYSLKAK